MMVHFITLLEHLLAVHFVNELQSCIALCRISRFGICWHVRCQENNTARTLHFAPYLDGSLSRHVVVLFPVWSVTYERDVYWAEVKDIYNDLGKYCLFARIGK
mmetsp:Transcript_31867/g.95381  ORF Transcript_31867/g.95381 Transcript_31867/m.95381 type:complete len:103 (-) Transcript_31867:1602-1910(-)